MVLKLNKKNTEMIEISIWNLFWHDIICKSVGSLEYNCNERYEWDSSYQVSQITGTGGSQSDILKWRNLATSKLQSEKGHKQVLQISVPSQMSNICAVK